MPDRREAVVAACCRIILAGVFDIMGLGRASLSTLLAVSLAACGGGGGSGGGNPISGGGGSSGGGSSTCSLSARQDFVKAVI
ncbi:MAG: hypothetical protein KDD90_11340, partial [Sphingomonadaceae bacterium]|nr:hypothetical protein [Sphingomonadaceae bacterium]